MKLTSHERIMRIFQNKEIDRPALKLWGAEVDGRYDLLHPAYKPVSRLAWEQSDIFSYFYSKFDVLCGKNKEKYYESWIEKTNSPLWVDEHRVYHTPKGDLHGIERISTVGEPGYTIEHLVKEEEDLELLLSMEYEPYPVEKARYDEMVNIVGDRGAVMAHLPHAGYEIQCHLGSETMAYFSIDCREELMEILNVYQKRVMQQAKNMIDAGIVGPYSWWGPEVFHAPLMGPKDFKAFVHDPDKPLCDMIHNAGGYVWVHAHGKVASLLDSYIDMGVDVLNPLEPPKNGDVHMGEIVKKYGNRLGWEGNIEIQELLQSPPERVMQLIDECVEMGSKSGRFILCPSAGFNEYPNPTKEYIDNLMLYLRYGLEVVEKYRK